VSQRLNSYFGTSPELRQLSRKAMGLLALQRHYEQLVPPTLARSSHVLQLEGQILTLAADNGAVAAKLRQLAPELTGQFRNKGCEVAGIQVRVQVSSSSDRPPLPARLSAAGRKRLIESAAELPDSPLKDALQRLAKNT
jgi:hypothetical protein